MINYNPNLYGKDITEYNGKLREVIRALNKVKILDQIINKYGSQMDRQFNHLINTIRKPPKQDESSN